MSAAVSAGLPDHLPDVHFNMARDHMADIPIFVLPAGYRLRGYRPGDEDTWTAIQRAAEKYIEIKDDLFERQFGGNRAALPGRMFFVETDAGRTVASASAWWEHDEYAPDDRGRVHWVVVHPQHQRRGLTKPLLTQVMQRLAQEHSRAMLGTSSARPWAVKCYLDFGFHPEPAELDDPKIAAAWRSVQGVLRHPGLESWLR